MTYRSTKNASRIASILDAHGPLTLHEPVAPEVISAYEGRVPDLILDFWENHGIGELGGGLMRLCIPDMFSEPLETLFAGDPDFGIGTFALAYGPFGNLIVWNEREWLALIAHPTAAVDAPFFRESKTGLDRDAVAFDYFLNADPRVMDVFADDGTELYDAARRELGPLKPGLIYGLLPPESFASVGLANLDAVVADEWLMARFSGQIYAIHDLIDDRLNIRFVEPQQ